MYASICYWIFYINKICYYSQYANDGSSGADRNGSQIDGFQLHLASDRRTWLDSTSSSKYSYRSLGCSSGNFNFLFHTKIIYSFLNTYIFFMYIPLFIGISSNGFLHQMSYFIVSLYLRNIWLYIIELYIASRL